MRASWRKAGVLVSVVATAALLSACSSSSNQDAGGTGSTGGTGDTGASVMPTKGVATTTSSAVASLSESTTTTSAPSGPTLYSWGYFGSRGELSSAQETPKQVTGIPGIIRQIAVSNSDTYVLTTAGTVWAFGADQYGELGNGTSSQTYSYFTPVQVIFPTGVKIALLANPMPYDTAMAIDTTGHVWGWGDNGNSDLCLGDDANVLAPTELPFTGATLAAGAGQHATYVSNGVAYSCGENEYGQNGTGALVAAPTPAAVQGLPAGTITALEASFGSSGALMATGQYYDWGYNGLGQLGDGSVTNTSIPQLVALPAPVSQVFQGSSSTVDGSTLVILSNGSVEGWGADGYGQLCNGSETATVLTPTAVVPPVGTHWTQVFVGGKASYALDSANNLWACGHDTQGELGNGTSESAEPTPVKVLSNVTLFASTQANEAALVNP